MEGFKIEMFKFERTNACGLFSNATRPRSCPKNSVRGDRGREGGKGGARLHQYMYVYKIILYVCTRTRALLVQDVVD